MVAPLVIAAGLQTLGGLLGGRSAQRARAAEAERLRQAGQQAFDASRFRPVGITTRFGSSQFQVDPNTGALIDADYMASPEVTGLQDRLFAQMGEQGLGAAEQALAAQQGLFNLGQQYLAQSPQEAAQQWLQSQQALLQPSRERALAQTRQNLFNTGREGLAIAQGGNLQATNPEMAAYYNALAQQDAQLAAQAMEQGRAQTTFGAGLFGSGLDLATAGYRPFATQFELARGLETAAQQPLEMGVNLGRTASGINAQAAQLRLNPQTAAASSQRIADSWNPFASALTSAGSMLGSMNFPTNSFQYSGWNAPNMGMFSGARSGDVGF